MIRVLHAIGAMNRAGAETLLMNFYRAIDRNEVQFDFLVHTDKPCDYDEEIESLGGRIFRVPRYNILNKNSYTKAVRTILREHPEDVIVHSHIGSAAPVHMDIAREEGRFGVVHSHGANGTLSPERLVFSLVTRPVRGKADHYLACSPQAGQDRFGKKITEGDAYSLVKNGIDTSKYQRNAEIALRAKKSLGFNDEPVFGHIGRLTHLKNQRFILEVFALILQKLPTAKLLLVGRGEDEEMLRQTTEKLHITDSVLFLGIRDDIPALLQAMDVFVFPSLHEGLPVATVEAQAAGIQSILSDTIPDMAVITDRTIQLPLGDPQAWADECIAAYHRSEDAKDDRTQMVADAGFDSSNTAAWLQEFYLEHASRLDSPKLSSSGA